MCHVSIALYPCGHEIIIGCFPCAQGMNSRICHPANLRVTIFTTQDIDSWGLKIPRECPASNSVRPCIDVPVDPTAFANYCLKKDVGIEDVVAVAPAWVFDMQGNKVGSKSVPWSVTDYVRAFYEAKNPVAMQNRLSNPKVEQTMKQEPGAEYRKFWSEGMKSDFEAWCAGANCSWPCCQPCKDCFLPQIEDEVESNFHIERET